MVGEVVGEPLHEPCCMNLAIKSLAMDMPY